MKFFHDRYGRHYPVKDIVSIAEYEGKKEPGKFYYATVELRDGREVLVSHYLVKELLTDGGRLLPAQPGFSLLKFWYDSRIHDEPYVAEDPVLGWRVDTEGHVSPITIDNEEYDHACGILCPDGKVRNHDTVYDDRDAWEAGNLLQANDPTGTARDQAEGPGAAQSAESGAG